MLKKIWLAVLLLSFGIVSCTQPTETQPTPPTSSVGGKTIKLVGNIPNWSRGARLLRTSLTNGAYSSIYEGSVATTGDFTITLPEPNSTVLTSFGAPANCSTGYTINPSNVRGNSLAQFNILTSTYVRSGTLLKANPNVRSPAAIGDRFVIYFYVDKDAVINADCPAIGTGITTKIDLSLKSGWNAGLVEFLPDNTVRYSNAAIPDDVNWQFTPVSDSTVTIGNAPQQLEVGQSASVSAAVTEPDGTPLPTVSQKLSWVSSNPDMVSVDNSGKLVAKRIGSTQVTVTVVDSPAIGATFSVSVYGLEVSGGTLNIDDKKLGVAARLRYADINGNPPNQSFDYTVIGPNGWNNNQPLAVKQTLLPPSPFSGATSVQVFMSEIAAVTGVYTLKINTPPVKLSAVGVKMQSIPTVGQWQTQPFQYPKAPSVSDQTIRTQDSGVSNATFTVDATKKFETVQNLRFTDPYSNGGVGIAWQWSVIPSPLTMQSEAEVYDLTDNKVVAPRKQAYSNATFDNLVIEKTHAYQYRVYASAVDYSLSLPYDVSLTTIIQDFRPLATQLEAIGGATTGGYTVTLNGANFDADTRVFFGTVEVTTKSFLNSSQMQVVVPPGTVGTVNITLKDKNGLSSTASSQPFKYFPISEYAADSPTKLLSIGNGAIAFIEYNGNASPQISLTRISSSGAITRLALPDVGYLSVQDLALDSSGGVWIALSDKVIRVNANDTLTEIALPSGVQPAMIAFGSDGNLWIARSDSYKITRIKPDGTQAADFSLIAQFSSSFNSYYELVLGPDNNLWFTSPNGIGRVTPSGSITTFSQSSTYNLISSKGFLWLSGNNALVRLATDGTTTSYAQFNSMGRLAAGLDGTFWSMGAPYLSTLGSALGFTRISDGVSSRISAVMLGSSGNFSSPSDVVTDSTGKIWYINGSKVGVLTP